MAGNMVLNLMSMWRAQDLNTRSNIILDVNSTKAFFFKDKNSHLNWQILNKIDYIPSCGGLHPIS